MLIIISTFRESKHNKIVESVKVATSIISSSMEKKAQEREC
jgi:hypothetical protein